MKLIDAAIQLDKELRDYKWLQTVAVTDSEIIVYLKYRKYDRQAVPSIYEGYNVRVEYMGEVRPA